MTTLTEKIGRNVLYTYAAYFLKIAVGIVLIPYIVETIGNERFGLWVIVAVVTQYFGLADLGIAHPFSKYVAEYYSRREYGMVNKVVSTGLAFYLFFSAAAIAVIYSLGARICGMFHPSPGLYPDAVFALRIGVLILVIELSTSCVSSVLRGLQRIDIQRKIQIVHICIGAAGTVFVLEKGYGIRGLFLNDLVCSAISALLEICCSFAIFPALAVRWRHVSREVFSLLFNFGIRVQASRLATLIAYQLDKLLIGYFLSLRLVAAYEIGEKISFTLRQTAMLIFPILVPAISELSVHRRKEEVYAYTLRLTKLMSFVMIPLTAFCVLAAPLIMTVWMGPGRELSARVTQILSVGYLAHLLPLVLYAAMQGVAKPHFQMWASIILSILNLFLSIALIRAIGFFGAPLGTSIAMIIAASFFICVAHRSYFGTPVLPRLREVLAAPVVSSLIASSPILTYNHFALHLVPGASRPANAAILCLEGILFAGVYLEMVRRKYFNAEERAALIRHIPYASFILEQEGSRR